MYPVQVRCASANYHCRRGLSRNRRQAKIIVQGGLNAGLTTLQCRPSTARRAYLTSLHSTHDIAAREAARFMSVDVSMYIFESKGLQLV